jgi:hypothetical protein
MVVDIKKILLSEKRPEGRADAGAEAGRRPTGDREGTAAGSDTEDTTAQRM